MNNPLQAAPRNRHEVIGNAPRTAMTLTPVYRWLIVLNAIVGAVSLALRLAAMSRGH